MALAGHVFLRRSGWMAECLLHVMMAQLQFLAFLVSKIQRLGSLASSGRAGKCLLSGALESCQQSWAKWTKGFTHFGRFIWEGVKVNSTQLPKLQRCPTGFGLGRYRVPHWQPGIERSVVKSQDAQWKYSFCEYEPQKNMNIREPVVCSEEINYVANHLYI